MQVSQSEVFCMCCRFCQSMSQFVKNIFLNVILSLHWKLCNKRTRSTISGCKGLPLCLNMFVLTFEMFPFRINSRVFSYICNMGPFLKFASLSLYSSSLIIVLLTFGSNTLAMYETI